MGLAILGGGVATTAGGVKLLRIYALYLHGLRELEKLVHPSSVGRAGGFSRRLRRQGAFIAFVFFMLFALSLMVASLVFAAFGSGFEEAMVLAVAGLTTTGPLVVWATEAPVALAELAGGARLAFAGTMVLGRFELLAIVALLSPALWRR
jgi:trk system potassium uptake protein TrkH